MENFIKVQFLKPVDGQTEYYFGSIAAIYDRFTSEEIGCSKHMLWRHKLASDNPKATRKCVITKHTMTRMPQHGKKSSEESISKTK